MFAEDRAQAGGLAVVAEEGRGGGVIGLGGVGVTAGAVGVGAGAEGIGQAVGSRCACTVSE